MLVVLVWPPAAAQQRYAKVIEPILAAWKTADVVCLGEGHGRYFDNELRMALVRHPDFPRFVRTGVVEMANPIHQVRARSLNRNSRLSR